MKQLLLFVLMLLPMVASADDSGKCGENVYYSYNAGTHTLIIYGQGDIASSPWYSYRNDIQSVIIELGVTSIGSNAFYKCRSLTSIIIPNSVTFIGVNAFCQCTSLTSITIPNSVTTIASSAFIGCSGLTSVTIPNSVTTIGKSAFAACENLTSVSIGNGVMSIGEEAFYCCSGLTSITIPNSVTSIGNIAFLRCIALTSITIPNSVTSIGKSAFKDCTSLTSVNILDIASWCNIAFYSIESNPLHFAHHLYIDGVEIKDLVIPNSVTSIGNYAFMGCTGLTSVTIPNSVTSIGSSAFSDCSGLSSVIVNSSPTTIGSSPFNGCTNIEEVTFDCETASPLFSGLSNIKKVTFSKNIKAIGEDAFDNCSGLTSIKVEEGNAIYDSRDNCNGIIKTDDNKLILGCQNTIIPNSVSSIGDGAFRGCTGLTSITIPNSVTSIGEDAFRDCTSLTSVNISDIASWSNIVFHYERSNPLHLAHHLYIDGVEIKDLVIPNSVTSIGNYAFMGCSGLSSVTISNSVTRICYDAFSGCSGLTSVTIPNSVTDIYPGAFEGCSKLTSVDIPNSVIGIGENVFYNCTGLTSVTIPNSVIIIDEDAFRNCTGLTSVTIPNSVKYIDEYAFMGCSGLTSIIIGSGVIKFSYKAFAFCPKLKDVYCFAENVPSTNANTFEGSYIEYATLHVPKGCLDTYKNVEPWKNFKSVLEVVDAKVKLSKTKATIEKGKTLTLKATVTPSTLSDKSVTWKSSNTKVATVTSAGKVKGVKAGTATITCTSKATGAKATCKVTVGYVKLDKTEAVINKDKAMTLKATVYPSTLEDKSVTWKSSNKKVATVTSKGKVKGVKAGTATITCTSNTTGLSATCEVTVGYVKLSKYEVAIQKGKTLSLKAAVYPKTLEDQSVTWESSDENIVKVNASTGKIKGMKVGTATITCTSVATGITATCEVTVTAAASARSLDGGDDETTGMDMDSAVVKPFDVYDLSGRKVLHQVTSLDGLPDGIYIVNGKKILK